MKQGKSVLFSLLAILSLQGCAPKVSEGYDAERGYIGNISISGAFALYPLAVLWSEDFKKENPDVRFNISAGGAGKGIADVLTNMVDIGLVSRDLHPQELEKGAFPILVANDAVIGTINTEHPNFKLIRERGLTQDELKGIFLGGKYKLWSDIDPRFVKKSIEVYVRSDAAGAAETWAKFFKSNQEDLKGIGIFGDPGLAQAIKDNELAIGFNNINYVYDLKTKKTSANIAALPIDLNKNGKIDADENFYDNIDQLTSAVAQQKYPSPPARELMFVVRNDKQTKLLKAFIEFVLEEKQQAYLLENGYVPLEKNIIAEQLQKLSSSDKQISKR
ncbi:phosphate ABC transporter substrate-binding protein [Sphingobacterium sp. DK4209]|uniref:Phosphate ABC transporter substrate-binding protein n=1 Tax=Sphingobacterium zhuxiongii TaxID=2662364 RepID=A0A5Q0QGZ2_9SPHI|nr:MULTISPECIES: PstS family phosphate ABC transporter substrate-binding protein [unclassified Sphingobacterium]MVZ66183.1 phosphate ABC transporter substrate-binding protein [Sphingobacterium sp. DK4209]QGA26600.1 phosphate ABC transporter substrate-binding protein [Sphingobacterium sp. dk4302]